MARKVNPKTEALRTDINSKLASIVGAVNSIHESMASQPHSTKGMAHLNLKPYSGDFLSEHSNSVYAEYQDGKGNKYIIQISKL